MLWQFIPHILTKQAPEVSRRHNLRIKIYPLEFFRVPAGRIEYCRREYFPVSSIRCKGVVRTDTYGAKTSIKKYLL